MPNIFEFVLVEQIFTDFTNSKPKFDFGAKPTISENEDFFKKDAEVWNLISYHGDHKTRTMFFSLVVCMHKQSFKCFHSITLKIYTIFQYVKMLCKPCDVIAHNISISH